MNLKQALRKKRSWVLLITFSVLGGLFGAFYASVFYAEPDRLNLLRGFRTGLMIALLTGGFELFFFGVLKNGWLRKLPFLGALLIRILITTILIRIALVSNEVLSNYMRGGSFTFEEDFYNQLRDTLVSFSIVVVFVVIAQFSALLGFHRFVNLVMGRYFRPVRERRAFLFVDLKDSTGLALKLGDIRFHEYLSKFFFEADQAIVQTGGEIVSYVGDAVIVTWPIGDNPVDNSRAVVALESIVARLIEIRSEFKTEFGVSPEIRAALHGGEVVVGECGDSRRQVTFLGEVVNITSRIEGETKARDCDFLASASILSSMDIPACVKTTSIGEVLLRGAETPIELVELKFERQKT